MLLQLNHEMANYEIQRTLINLEEVDFPETLYKYRFWSKPVNQTILTKREVFFSPPSDFEDIYDCKIPTRWDLITDQEILNYYFEDSLRMLGQTATLDERMEFAIHHANNNDLRDEKFLEEKQEVHFKQYNERIGVLSMTPFNNLQALWLKYADDHRGFCVGFDPYYMLKGIGTGAGLVEYSTELPLIYPSVRMPYEVQMHHQMFCKLQQWDFEEEYRTFISKDGKLTLNERKKIIPPEAFKEIILGARMSDHDKNHLLENLPEELLGIPVRTAQLTENEISIIEV